MGPRHYGSGFRTRDAGFMAQVLGFWTQDVGFGFDLGIFPDMGSLIQAQLLGYLFRSHVSRNCLMGTCLD